MVFTEFSKHVENNVPRFRFPQVILCPPGSLKPLKRSVCVCVCVCWYCVTRFSLWYQCIDNTNVNINIRTLPVQHFDNFPIVHHYHHSHCNFEICLAKVAVISTFKSFNYNCRKLPHLCSFFYVLFSRDI